MSEISQYLILFVSFVSCFKPAHFIIALPAHFRFQYLFLSIIFLIIFSILKRRAVIFSALLSIIINAYPIAPYYFDTNFNNEVNTESNYSKSTIRIMMTNIYTQNNLKSELLSQVRELNPDILVLLEINEDWKNEFEKLKKNYDYFIHKTREDNFGIGLLSKLKIKDFEVKSLSIGFPPSISAILESQNKKIHFIATHPVPPLGSLKFDMRNQQLVDIAIEFQNTNADYQILAGDLNVTPWSYYFKKLESASNLRDSRLGYGYSPTWPTNRKIMYIPIDYILLSQNIQVENFQTEILRGSDHKAVICDILLN